MREAGDNNFNDGEKNKVTPLDAHRNKSQKRPVPDGQADTESLRELLSHMRRVREAVPVNERLREDLRERLSRARSAGADRREPAAAEIGTVVPPLLPSAGARPGWQRFWWLLPAALLLAAAFWSWWPGTALRSLEAGSTRDITRFRPEGRPLEFACAPENRGFIAVSEGALQLLDSQGSHTGMVKPPEGSSYASPALTPDGSELALVRRSGAGEEIATAPAPPGPLRAGAAEQLEAALAEAGAVLKVEPGKSLSGLAWSPDGRTLAYALGETGVQNEEIYLLEKGKEPAHLGAGRNPTWSPDGTMLVVERAGDSARPELWLTDAGGKRAVRLAEGEKPAWGRRGFLAFTRVKTTERVLAYGPDGAPLFTVRQSQDEVRTLYLGRSGDNAPTQPDGLPPQEGRLLLAPAAGPGADELNWLKRLELEGVREPRTLLLEQAGYLQDLDFSPDGRTLLAARRDPGGVSLVQVSLHEKYSRGGGIN